jgi:hypothetical protein
MADYIYPTSSEITEIAQTLLPDLTMDDPIFSIMPITEVDSHILEWEQMDDYKGMQQLRGLNGQPARVKNVGGKRFYMQPGVYGEFIPVDEAEITTRRRWGTFNEPINIEDLVMMKSEQLLHRRVKRLKYVGWTLLIYGSFTVFTPNGAMAHQDAYQSQTYAAAISWSNAASSTPLQNLRDINVLALGKSVSFGADATLYVNRVTANYLLANTNAGDLGGKRTTGLSNVLSMKQVNELLTGEDLPNIAIYEGGYEDESGVFQRFIPTGRGVIVGKRTDNGRIMEYRMTRNANNPGAAPGPYMKVVDNGERAVPREIIVHDGHNGGPILYHPGAIVSISV